MCYANRLVELSTLINRGRDFPASLSEHFHSIQSEKLKAIAEIANLPNEDLKPWRIR